MTHTQHVSCTEMVEHLRVSMNAASVQEVFRRAYAQEMGPTGSQVIDTDYRLYCDGEVHPPTYIQLAYRKLKTS